MCAIMTVRLFPPSESCQPQTHKKKKINHQSSNRKMLHGDLFRLSYLQQASQLAVSIVDVFMAVFVTESVDAVAQSQKRTVDVGSLLQPLAPVLSLTDTHTQIQTIHLYCAVFHIFVRKWNKREHVFNIIHHERYTKTDSGSNWM